MNKSLSMSPLAAVLLRVFICGLPLMLLLDTSATFGLDWFNHLWAVEYFGAYFKQHYAPAVILNTDNLMGIANFLFYANYWHTFMGVLSIALGSAVAVRVMFLVCLLLQFFHLERAIRVVSGHPGYAFFISILVTWSTYQITNIYHRAAIPEFMAVCLLSCSVASLLVLLYKLSKGEKSWYDAVALGFYFLLVALTHPLTGMYGAASLAIIAVIGILHLRSAWLLYVFAGNAVLGVLSMASWLYVLKCYNKYLALNLKNAHRADLFWESNNYGFTIFQDLFAPSPYSRATLYMGTAIENPFLETQALVPLLVLVIAFLWIWWKAGLSSAFTSADCPKEKRLCAYIFLAGFFIFAFTTLGVVFPFISTLLGHIFHPMQYTYRLVTYVNLGIIIMAWSMLGVLRDHPAIAQSESSEKVTDSEAVNRVSPVLMPVFIAIACTIAVTSLWVKLLHADVVNNLLYVDQSDFKNWAPRKVPPDEWRPGVFGLGQHIDVLPFTFYGHTAYIITEGTARPPSPPMREQFAIFRAPPPTPGSFGGALPVEVDLPEATCVITNLNPFPWNKLLVDGVERDVSSLTVRDYPYAPGSLKVSIPTYAVVLPAGKHVLQYRSDIDPTWQKLNAMSWSVVLLWAALYGATLLAVARSGAFGPWLQEPILGVNPPQPQP